jgi:hypothetical protein
LHALERLAQNNPAQRQTIIDVICAYVRMPFPLPDDKPPGEDAPADAHTRYEQRRQELQVRLTAQRLLVAHLWPDAADTFWPDINLDLTEAQLYRFDLTDCCVGDAHTHAVQQRAVLRDSAVRQSTVPRGRQVRRGAVFRGASATSGGQTSFLASALDHSRSPRR